MAFREVPVFEIREVLRLWLRGELLPVDQHSTRHTTSGLASASTSPIPAWRSSHWPYRPQTFQGDAYRRRHDRAVGFVRIETHPVSLPLPHAAGTPSGTR